MGVEGPLLCASEGQGLLCELKLAMTLKSIADLGEAD
jgi:hypothetical protein